MPGHRGDGLCPPLSSFHLYHCILLNPPPPALSTVLYTSKLLSLFFIIHFISSTSTSCLRGQIHLITWSPLSLPLSKVQKVFVWHCPLHMHLNTHSLLHLHTLIDTYGCFVHQDLTWMGVCGSYILEPFIYEMKDERAKENLTTYSYSTFCTSVCHLLIHGNWVALSIVSWGEKRIKQALRLDQDKMLAAHTDHT